MRSTSAAVSSEPIIEHTVHRPSLSSPLPPPAVFSEVAAAETSKSAVAAAAAPTSDDADLPEGWIKKFSNSKKKEYVCINGLRASRRASRTRTQITPRPPTHPLC